MAYSRRPADVDADEVPGLGRRLVLAGAAEPAEEHVRVRRPRLQHDLAARLEPVVEAQRADFVRVVGVLAGAPEGAADLAGLLAAGVVGGAEAEVVRPGDILRPVRGAVAGGGPLRVLGEILGSIEVFQ